MDIAVPGISGVISEHLDQWPVVFIWKDQSQPSCAQNCTGHVTVPLEALQSASLIDNRGRMRQAVTRYLFLTSCVVSIDRNMQVLHYGLRSAGSAGDKTSGKHAESTP